MMMMEGWQSLKTFTSRMVTSDAGTPHVQRLACTCMYSLAKLPTLYVVRRHGRERCKAHYTKLRETSRQRIGRIEACTRKDWRSSSGGHATAACAISRTYARWAATLNRPGWGVGATQSRLRSQGIPLP